MNPYGEPQSSRARARVPGPGNSAPDDDQSSYRPAPDAYRRGAGGRASVGSAPAGSASVGSASVGSARVGARASVGAAAPVRGTGPVARAAVRPGPPARTPDDEGSIGGGGRSGGGKDKSKAAKRRRRTNILTAAAAVLVIMLGAGVVGGTYFFDDVDLPSPVSEDQSNVILDTKGAVLAKLGEQNRTVVPEAQINKVVEHAVAAAEDKNFYKHHGIDMKGIVRAAWNNFTGGDQQGASTITQQYARHAADLKDISYNRKLREAVIARKMEGKYNKDQIMGMYLNYIYLGRGLYGIQAAAQGYFGKSVTTKAGQKNAITPYEAAVLASIIKQPEPTATHKGYDPTINPTDAKARWEYTMANMLEMGWISQDVYNKRKYPTVKKAAKSSATKGVDGKPVGMIMRHVRAELAEMGISEQEFDKGGLTVTTTIDPVVQKAAEEAGSRKSESSPMNDKPATYQAAVIGIDPKTGRVLGYYGGDDPTGIDYGGYMRGDTLKIDGGQSPGSTFKIYTLAAALREDISFKTRWDGTKLRPNGTKISNAGADPGTVCKGQIKRCDLETATIKSYNFPFYWIADGIGRDKVIAAARDAGVGHMYTDDGKLVDLNKTDKETWTKKGYFDNEVAFGQYRVVPLEHAEGVATIVGGGVHHDAHFIRSVSRVDPDTGQKSIVGSEKIDGKEVFNPDQMSNLQSVMKEIVEVDDRDLRNGQEGIAKSGTWEFKEGSGDTWFVGGMPQLAATVWVGGAKNKVELKEANGRDMFGAGTPSRIWKKFLDAVIKAKDLEREDFPRRVETGNPDSSFANGQAAPPPPQNQPDNNNDGCVLDFICGPDGNNGNNGGGNNGGGNNGGGNNNGGGDPDDGDNPDDGGGNPEDGTNPDNGNNPVPPASPGQTGEPENDGD
ncbi:transglycosylase domain-containing protein [Actinoplanes sp. TRM 88003]|uniref:Transglycosylase domain-containing protein n=1 Tax=Paractinoplanes aksuensis TaxID=2939490 RepID=A0ABT1DWN9_9ACTN|nr:transglycosylase domain-containing protein [Actinoplanes aksuensis]MCO8275269.1 transglycosylase domain-containing protein [Actinoplanes aksuensis]